MFSKLASISLLSIIALVLADSSKDTVNSNSYGVGPLENDVSNFKDKIKNVVILVQENRSFDNICGGFNYTQGIDNLLNYQFCNPVNVTDPNSPVFCSSSVDPDALLHDPNHSVSGTNFELFGTFAPNENLVNAGENGTHFESMIGFLSTHLQSYHLTNATQGMEAVNYYNPNELPVLTTLAEEFVLFDRWFASIPGPTNSNRAYLTSGTSHGFGDDSNFGVGSVPSLPQVSIFEQLTEKGIDWINYSNRTFPSAPDASFYNWTLSTGMNHTNVVHIDQFFEDAKDGKLPTFTYINPECCTWNSFHPVGSMYWGQVFVKQIYEALRSSPQWDNMLFIMTMDEHGGFADHVPPPTDVPPPGDGLNWTETALNGQKVTFDFRRLGVRVPTWFISPWVEKTQVENKGQNYGGEYSHTSILHTLANLWDLNVTTERVAWSSTFEHLITNKFRKDTPDTLPNALNF